MSYQRGNCYVASEALYHLIGGKAAGWTPMRMRTWNDTHWFLRHESGVILDPTMGTLTTGKPDYELGRGCGFLTKQPSKRAVVLMGHITENTNE